MSVDVIMIKDIDIMTFLPNNIQAYSKNKTNTQFSNFFNNILISNVNNSLDWLSDQSCLIYASYTIKFPISDNQTLTINFIDKYHYNVIGNLWDPMEDIDPILLSQFGNMSTVPIASK